MITHQLIPAKPAATAPPSFTPVRGGLLQRKCACGSPTSSLTGECSECESKTRLQTKLTIGASNDALEQEADRIADQVLAARAHSAITGAAPRIQRYTGQATGRADTAAATVDRVLASPGRPLDATLRQDMEQRFGHDFSRVRVHADARAAESARAVRAGAYTVGQHIAFRESSFSRHLLAHELAHTIQQRDATGDGIDMSEDRRLEADADRAVAEVEGGGLRQPLRPLPSVGLQMQAETDPAAREEQLWEELGIDSLLMNIWFMLDSDMFPHPRRISCNSNGACTGGPIYDPTALQQKLLDRKASMRRLNMYSRPENFTQKELEHLYYWYPDESKQLYQAYLKLGATLKDEQSKRELEELKARFSAAERFALVALGGSAAIGAGAGLVASGAAIGAVTTVGRVVPGTVRASGQAAKSLVGKVNQRAVAMAVAAAPVVAKTADAANKVIFSQQGLWAARNIEPIVDVGTATISTAAQLVEQGSVDPVQVGSDFLTILASHGSSKGSKGPRLGTHTEQPEVFAPSPASRLSPVASSDVDFVTVGQARGADVSVGGPRPTVPVDTLEPTPPVRPSAPTPDRPGLEVAPGVFRRRPPSAPPVVPVRPIASTPPTITPPRRKKRPPIKRRRYYFGGGGGKAGRKGMRRTTPMPKVEKAPQLKTPAAKPSPGLSESERAMVSSAKLAVSRLGKPLKVKTKAAGEEGVVQRSGSGKRGGGGKRTKQVMDRGKEIDHEFAENASLDGGIPGQEKASHAEKLAAIDNPGKALAVDRAMCLDCFAYFQKEAQKIGTSVVVQEPTTTWVFRSDGVRVGLSLHSSGQIVLYPDGSRAGSLVASADPVP